MTKREVLVAMCHGVRPVLCLLSAEAYRQAALEHSTAMLLAGAGKMWEWAAQALQEASGAELGWLLSYAMRLGATEDEAWALVVEQGSAERE